MYLLHPFQSHAVSAAVRYATRDLTVIFGEKGSDSSHIETGWQSNDAI
jgi:hypothetical protein